MQQAVPPIREKQSLSLHRQQQRRKRSFSSLLLFLVSSSHCPSGIAFSPKFSTHQHSRPALSSYSKPESWSLIRRWNANVWTNGDSSSSASPSNNKNQTEDPNPLVFTPADDEQAPTTTRSKRRMSLMWCDRDKCKDVVRERIVGKHNQLILNGPATGQVAYRWRDEDATLRSASPSSSNSHTKDTAATTSISASILLLVKPDDRLFQQAAQILPQLTQAGIQVLLVPELAAELKDTYGLDDDDDDKDTNSVENANIVPFDPPAETNAFRQDRRVDDDEEDWVQDLWPMEPFPDLICTLGGDGLLIHASMLFQGPIPPILSIAGGSLGFLTCFEIEEMVDSIKIALGVSSNEESSDSPEADELEVFPPNMPSYPYEPLMIQRPRQHWEGPQAKATFGMDGVICMTVRMRLDCRVVNPEGIVRNRYNVLNEVVIDRGSSSYLANLECFCDDVHLTTVQADGIIFATPTGSTAYSMAAGGSVVHPAVPCILVTPICPHVLSFRSMVFPDHVVLRCYVPEDARSAASVSFDGKHRLDLQRGDSVQIQMSAYPVPTLNRGDHSSDWLESLKRSFNFNTRPRQKPLQ